MYYVSNDILNKLIDWIITKLHGYLSERKSVQKKLSDYEYARKHNQSREGVYLGSWSTTKEGNFRLAAWEYLKRASTILIVVVAVVAIAAVRIWDAHQRSQAAAGLWRAVQANNETKDVVSPSGIGATMPCDASETLDNNQYFTGASYTCDYLTSPYSTKNLSTSQMYFAAHPAPNQSESHNLAFYLDNAEVSYSFGVDTMKDGVSPDPYLINCVDSTQDQVNDSDVPGEVMHVVMNQVNNLQTALGANVPFKFCEWGGDKGTVNLSAETVQNGNVIVELNALTDTAHDNNLLQKFVKVLVGMGYR